MKSTQGKSSAVGPGSCWIHISEKPVYRKGDHTLLTRSSAGPKRIVILRRSNGRLAVDIYDGKSRLWVRLEFYSLEELLFVLLGEQVPLERTVVSGSSIPSLPSTLDWVNLSSWLRGILPTFYETRVKEQS